MDPNIVATISRRKFAVLRRLATQSACTQRTKLQQQVLLQSCDILQTLPRSSLEEYISTAMLNAIIDCMKPHNKHRLCSRAATTLVHVTLHSSKDLLLQLVQQTELLGVLKLLLYSSSPKLCTKALLILGNLMPVDLSIRKEIVGAEIIHALVDIIRPGMDHIQLGHIFWLFYHVLNDQTSELCMQCVISIANVLRRLLTTQQDLLILEPALKLVHLISQHEQFIDAAIINTGLLKCCANFVPHISEELQLSALYIIGKICYGTRLQTLYALTLGFIRHMHSLILGGSTELRTLCLNVLANVAASNADFVNHIIHAGILTKIIKCVNDDELQIRIEAAWTLSNLIIHAHHAHLVMMLQHGVLPPLCQLLPQADQQLQQNIVVAFLCMLRMLGHDNLQIRCSMERYGAIECMRHMQKSEDRLLSFLTRYIMCHWFEHYAIGPMLNLRQEQYLLYMPE